MKYAWIAKNKAAWPVTVTCDVLDVSTSGYFEHQRRRQTRQPSPRDDEHQPQAEKYDKIEKLVQHYYYHATDFTTKQIKRLHELKIHERREKLSS